MIENKKLIIETKNLEFGFNGKEKIIKNINLNVEQGSIYGFLGPNGAGKTTTIRLLIGLLNGSKSSIKLFGKNISNSRQDIFSKIGALIEQPSLYEHISGYDNIEITRLIKKLERSKTDKILSLVELSGAAHKKVKSYSLGMKQRLGLAIALISEPELLILDEPTNGLDPNGIVEIRELLKKINNELGTTIFLSSHLLSEIEKLVTHIGIINMGKLLYQGTVNDFIKTGNNTQKLKIETSDNKSAIRIIKRNFEIQKNEEELKVIIKSKNQAAEIINELVMNNIKVYEAAIEKINLEQLFIHITENYKIN